ncbi:MAG: DNA cytosine methyltransferase [Alphaproteobacteria bacterium]|nr:DNA cytosine methyltransferase [Alphaproteobacteria bacterium]
MTINGLIVDNFAGGGGASTGIEMGLGCSIDIAINHDDEAVAMHTANHPGAEHLCQSVWRADPRDVTKGRPVSLAWFSPDCKHFSKAKGGKPVEKHIRDLAWVVVHWAKLVRPAVIMLENVEEFKDWGPLTSTEDGKLIPCPLRKGFTFRRWCGELKKLGYKIEYRELRACDYGAPTIRKRLFLIARCDGKPIVWPAPTHGPGLIPYRTAADCIDWSIPCPSIFERKRPLAEATLRRIAKGIFRYVIDAPKPFIVQYHSAKREGDHRTASVDDHDIKTAQAIRETMA